MSQLSVVLAKIKVSKGKETPDCGRGPKEPKQETPATKAKKAKPIGA